MPGRNSEHNTGPFSTAPEGLDAEAARASYYTPPRADAGPFSTGPDDSAVALAAARIAHAQSGSPFVAAASGEIEEGHSHDNYW